MRELGWTSLQPDDLVPAALSAGLLASPPRGSYSEEQIVQLRLYVAALRQSSELLRLFDLILACGLRHDEAARLWESDLTRQYGFVRVRGTNAKGGRERTVACQAWLEALLSASVQVRVPDIADYEIRRELLRARKTRGIERLDALRLRVGHLAVTTEVLLLAAEFWARLRQHGLPTAGPAELDADVILASQAALLIGAGHSVIIATTNAGHLSRLVPADLWQHITS